MNASHFALSLVPFAYTKQGISAKYLSASIAAIQPLPAAVTACR
jgi:hypothetical protein